MITVLFPAGAFGSTIEYCLRNFSLELDSIRAEVQDDGSMHLFNKEFHPKLIGEFDLIHNWGIATPVYPGFDYLDPVMTVQKIKDKLPGQQKVILIQFSTVDQVYRNCLFKYYKIPTHIDTVLKNKSSAWNSEYTCVADMHTYEIREALSFSMDQAENYLQVVNQVSSNWLCVTPDDILYNFKNTITTILEHCDLTLDPACDIDNFYKKWFEKQQYIIEEFQSIQKILTSLQNREFYEWSPLSIMGEAIVQYCLRDQGIEIACHDLNQFPTSTEELKHIIIKGIQ